MSAVAAAIAAPAVALRFRDAVPTDLAAMLEIERVAHLTPWTEGNFVDSFEAAHTMLLAMDGDGIAGYAISMQVIDEAHLLTLAVAPTLQRRGIGRALFAAWRQRVGAAGATRLYLEVRAGNTAARGLYAREGLIEIGRRKAYYGFADRNRGREDAIVMACDVA